MTGIARQSQTVSIGQRLRALRVDRGLSQEAVADRLNIRQTYVSRWECGKNCPNHEYLARLADVYETSIDHILRGDVAIQAARVA